MIDVQGSRKLIAAGVVVALASAAVIIKGDVPNGFVTILEYVFAAFVAGNSIEHITSAVKARAEANASDAPDDEASATGATAESIDQKIDSVAAQVAQVAQSDAEAKQSLGLILNTLSTIIRKLKIDQIP